MSECTTPVRALPIELTHGVLLSGSSSETIDIRFVSDLILTRIGRRQGPQRLCNRLYPLQAASRLLVRLSWQSFDSRARQKRGEGFDRVAHQDLSVILDEQRGWHVEIHESVRVDRTSNRARQQRRQVPGRAADGSNAWFREAVAPVRADPCPQEQVESAVGLALFGQNRGLVHHFQMGRSNLASRLLC